MKTVQLVHPYESLPHDEDGDVVIWLAVPDGFEVKPCDGSPWTVLPTDFEDIVPGTDVLATEARQ